MDNATAYRLLDIGKAFNLNSPFFSYEEIKMGNVNHSYKVNYIQDDGTGMARIKSYFVQNVNTYAFRYPVELMENIEKVTEHIRRKQPDRVNLHFHHTADHKNYLQAEDGFWRVLNYIPSVTFNSCQDIETVRATGQAFGEFQTALSDFDADSLFYTIPDFHNTVKRYEALENDVKADPCGRVQKVQKELDYLFSVRDMACRLTRLFEEGKLPLRVTHNDTKINNVLFDADTHKPLVVIDLDTVMPGLVGHDFGDAVRYAANFSEEDEVDTSKTGLNLNVFWAFAEGFLKETAAQLTDAEIDTLALSCFSITCELAVRFISDYIIGDKYFKTRSEEHNLERARCQIVLAQDMLKKMDAMDAIVKASARKYRG